MNFGTNFGRKFNDFSHMFGTIVVKNTRLTDQNSLGRLGCANCEKRPEGDAVMSLGDTMNARLIFAPGIFARGIFARLILARMI